MRNNKYTIGNFIVATIFVFFKLFFVILYQEVIQKGKKEGKRKEERGIRRKKKPEKNIVIPSLLFCNMITFTLIPHSLKCSLNIQKMAWICS